jgi:branched-chain amino acid transport system substrate-binding protein
MKQSESVILKIGAGDLKTTGFPFTLQILGRDQQFEGQLPPAPDLPDRFEQWQMVANNLGHRVLITTPTTQVTNVDIVDDCRTAAIALEMAINHWLGQSNVLNSLFVPLFRALPEEPGLKFFIQTSDPLLQRLPWQVWQLLTQTYPDVEVILSAELRPNAVRFKWPVRILAIEGDTSGTEAKLDLTPIERIPGITVIPLEQPTKAKLQEHLWDESWDILVFMGHSRSQGQTGEIALNAHETLSLDDLHETFKYSAKNGLKLAIFNSCDGVGIASKLADLRIPYTIAMRQPIPDTIAQMFLQTLLKQFAQRKSLHESVNIARRQLQDSQGRFPCAAWLPVIYQNPAAPDIRFPRSVTIKRRWKYFLLGLLALGLALIGAFLQTRDAQIYAERTSLGDRLLSQCSLTNNAGLKHASAAFAAQQYDSAAQQFQTFLKIHECPEINIYHNNAAIRASKQPIIGRIAASVPIGGNNDGTAEQMLRGIAQAQEDAIKQNQPIEVMIVADGNGKARDGTQLMPIIVPRIVKDTAIKAVIGPNASDAARESANLYGNGKLLMITPTAFYGRFSDMGDYVYRMLPTNKEFTKPLAEYASAHGGKADRVIIYEDSRSRDNSAVADAFGEILGPEKIIPMQYGSPSSSTTIAEELAKHQGRAITTLLIAPHIEHMDDAMRIAQSAKSQGLKLLGTPTFFADNILDVPGTARLLEGMVFYAPWSPHAARENIFSSRWRRHVTWRTATSYDAFQMVRAGLAAGFHDQRQTTRHEMYKFFKQYQANASHKGTTGTIQFTEKGDRTGKLPHGELLEIKQDPQGKWQFLPVAPPPKS